MTPSQLFHGCMTAFRTDADIEIPDCFYKLRHGHTGIALFETQSTLNFTDYAQVTGFHAVIQKTIVTDLLETCRQYVQEITPYEFCMSQGYPAFGLSRLFSSGGERNVLIVKVKNAAVRDRNLMGVASKVFHGIAKTVKGFLDIRAPVLFIKCIVPFLPYRRILPVFTGGRKSKGTILVQRLQESQIFALELVTKHTGGIKKPEEAFRIF